MWKERFSGRYPSNFIVIGQRHGGRVTVIPSRGKEVPDGVDMLAFYKPMLL